MFWLIAALLTIVVTLVTVLPLFRMRAVAAPARAEHDAEVYRAQLLELTADEARGAIRTEDAAVARAEIGRRLLKTAADPEAAKADRTGSGRLPLFAGLAVALVLPIGSFLFYDRAGSPEVRDQPLASREAAPEPEPDIAAMVAQIERRLAEQPDDGAGWNVVAPVYLQMGEAKKAATAFRNAIRLNGPTAQTVAGLGEALVQDAGGEVTPEAEATFRQSLGLDPSWPPARFYLALNLSQEARYAEADKAWSDLIGSSPADAPWLAIAQAAREDARTKLGQAPAAPQVATAQPGPDAAAMAAAAELPEADRQAMIEGMVSQLATRLKTAPNDVEGWKRLIRSYTVMGNEAGARSALAEASAVFPAGSPERMDIAGLARDLGLPEAGDTTPR